MCRKCLKGKVSNSFCIHSRYKGKTYRRKICRDCDSKMAAAWKLENRDRALAWRREYEKNNPQIAKLKLAREMLFRKEFPLLARMRDSEKRKKNPETARKASKSYRSRHPEKCKEASSRWLDKNPEYMRTAAKIRRDRKRANGGGYTHLEWAIIVANNPACPKCLKPWSETMRPTVDHVIPISRGGRNDAANIQPLCLRCNISKGNRVEVFA